MKPEKINGFIVIVSIIASIIFIGTITIGTLGLIHVLKYHTFISYLVMAVGIYLTTINLSLVILANKLKKDNKDQDKIIKLMRILAWASLNRYALWTLK